MSGMQTVLDNKSLYTIKQLIISKLFSVMGDGKLFISF